MELLNVSIGAVQTIQVGSEVIKTGHIKAPAAEPWRITLDGAAGDQRATHPDKIYAFARAGYAHWGEYLRVDPEKWPDGFFGENLTLDELDETEVRVGDVFALGQDVQLVVAGARTPCIKLAWRLDQPRSFLKLFAGSRRTGMYMGVLREGIVRGGDVLRRIEHDPAMPSVADVCDMIASRDAPSLEQLARLLDCPHLSPTNRMLLSAKRDAAERAQRERIGGWRGWRPFRIDRVIEEAPGIRSVYLRPEDGKPLASARPGQHVAVRMPMPDGKFVVRYWSLSALAEEPDQYRLTVRRQDGEGSRWLHAVEPDASLSLRAPEGTFVLDEGGFRPVVLVAAGIGITPLLAMLEAHLRRRDAPIIRLIYGARTPADMAFRRELDALAEAHRTLKVHYLYTQSEGGTLPAGRIDADRVIRLLNDLYVIVDGRRVELPWNESDIYICGPGDLCERLRAELITRGGHDDHIAFESFVAVAADAPEIEQAEIVFARSGVTVAWSAEEDLSILELAEGAGVDLPSDCRAGTCLTCISSVVAGAATVSLDGSTLPCIARPASARLVLDA